MRRGGGQATSIVTRSDCRHRALCCELACAKHEIGNRWHCDLHDAPRRTPGHRRIDPGRTLPHPATMLTRIGPWRVDLLEAGTLWLDGGAMFGSVPKPLWAKLQPP